MASKKPSPHVSKIGFARHHSIMMMLVVIFFGILVYRGSRGKMRPMKKMEGTVVEIIHSQSNPPLSYVKIEYTLNHKKIKIDETLPSLVAKNDVIIFYMTASGKAVFSPPFPTWVYWVMVIIYLILLLMSIILVVYFHVQKNDSHE